MQQDYHSNAVTNIHILRQIKESSFFDKFSISPNLSYFSCYHQQLEKQGNVWRYKHTFSSDRICFKWTGRKFGCLQQDGIYESTN